MASFVTLAALSSARRNGPEVGVEERNPAGESATRQFRFRIALESGPANSEKLSQAYAGCCGMPSSAEIRVLPW